MAPRKGEYRWGSRQFWKCRAGVGSGPAPGPTLKKRPCAILVRLVERRTNTASFSLRSSQCWILHLVVAFALLPRLSHASCGRIRLTSRIESHISWSHSPYFRGWVAHLVVAFALLPRLNPILPSPRYAKRSFLRVGVSLTVLTDSTKQTTRRHVRRVL